MRVAVVGATGNAGTAVLAALQERSEVESVLGIARRLPDRDAPPYAGAEWASIDIAAAVDPKEARARLVRAFAGADAVIHLAWLIQPNRQRDLLRRVNVEGTRTVLHAAAEAGVRSVVVASSVGAYAPSPGGKARDETWATDGIRSSHYSVDKAAQERVLDEFEAVHPQIAVARLRPALIFSAEAASEIQRYFLGRWVPAAALRAGRLPLLPVPTGLRIQAVHADDVGAAYAAAVVQGARGAFNIAADYLLGVRELADVVDHGHCVELPPPVVRTVLAAAHRAGLVPADPGWLDMGMNVPVMDTSRAKAELGWRPRRTAAETLTELLSGMTDGAGTGSVPLRPRDAGRAHLPVAPVAAGAGAGATGVTGADGPPTTGDGADWISPRISRDLLNLYLSDHLTGAQAGVSRIERMAEDFVDTPVFGPLSEIAEEIRAEHRFLQQLIRDLGFRRLRYRQAVAWVGEHAGRLKNNGRIVHRSPMTMVLETELMHSAVVGKRGGWLTLHANAEDLGLDPGLFSDLAENALRQADTLDDVHEYACQRAFRTDRETFTPQS